MHEALMQVPNLLFYGNKIKSGYEISRWKQFMYSEQPFLFIDLPDSKQSIRGTSFCNMDEVSAIVKLKDWCLNIFKQTCNASSVWDPVKNCHVKKSNLMEQHFTKNSIYVITPYNAQKNAIHEYFADDEIEDQVLSIDSSQGREFDLVFVSMVRTNSGRFIQDENRINVALTRAKHGLVIIGHAQTLRKKENWA